MSRQLPHNVSLHCLLRYDPETGTLFWKWRPRNLFEDDGTWKTWNARYSGQPALNCIDHQGYRYGAFDGRKYAAHRIIWKMAHISDPDHIDHIDGDRSNNRLSNLRSVCKAENSRNQGLRVDNRSGVPGVYLRGKRWLARITVNRKIIRLGTFDTFEAAVEARREAEARFEFHSNHGARPTFGFVSEREAA